MRACQRLPVDAGAQTGQGLSTRALGLEWDTRLEWGTRQVRKSVKAFTDAILDLIVEDPVIVAGRKDYMGKPEVSEYCITIRSYHSAIVPSGRQPLHARCAPSTPGPASYSRTPAGAVPRP